MSTAVDFKHDAALMAATTVRTLRSNKAKTHLAARAGRSVHQGPVAVHRGGQVTHE